MPHVEVNGVRLYYTEAGAGDETIVFSHGLILSSEMFSRQVERLSRRYRCIAYDHRGQGRSAVTGSGYDMGTIADDAAALIGKLGAAPCHFVGLSMGGFVGMRLAIHRPELVRSLILMETSADPEPAENKPKYRLLNFVARWFGLNVVVGRVMAILFGKTFMSDPARETERLKWRQNIVANDRNGITKAVTGVIEREGVYDLLDRIKVPTLVIVGEEDTATVPAKAERIASAIAGARLVSIPRAGHSSSIEQPDAVTEAIELFLDAQKRTETMRGGAKSAKPRKPRQRVKSPLRKGDDGERIQKP